mgnify:CR=1 FL=1
MAIETQHMQELSVIGNALNQSQSVVILEHEKPDGDCIGSGLALSMFLSSMDKKVALLSPDPHPVVYDFLPGQWLYTVSSLFDQGSFQDAITVFLDCASPERTGQALSFAMGRPWINIDHHVSNLQFGDINLVDSDASAAGELVFFLLKAMNAQITKDMATCLYVAIATDTGGFRYQNTTPRALRVAAELVGLGASPSEIAGHLYEARTLSSIVLLCTVLKTLAFHHEGKVALVEVTDGMVEEAGSSFEEAEGIIDYPRSISGVEVSLCFKEDSSNEGVRISMRSKSKIDVSSLAGLFGGGGHPRAAGAFVQGSMEEVKSKVLKALDDPVLWTDS